MASHAMRLVPSGLLALLIIASSTNAFAPSPMSWWQSHRVSPALRDTAGNDAEDSSSCAWASASAVVVSGSPSKRARAVDVRGALASSSTTVYRLDGSKISTSDLLAPDDDDGGKTTLLVLTRSFGDRLVEAGVYFALVSIGRPDVGLALCEHLGVKDGEDWIYADPDNGVYDALMLNRGWDTMIRPATALRFRDRIFGGGGGRGEGSLDQLFEVLGKWNKAFYIPPKLEQSTIHGGTFVLSSSSVVFAHYDESPGTHVDPSVAVDIAIREATK
ncbi:hypothetical protein ACHAW5_009478 [Stephanodiscus triporus]|uniref:Uncharacterized protein n=1 Tax=Stephanodiscus triporus TaxID=2934178 RepID=A0ABD3QSB8_9STRA